MDLYDPCPCGSGKKFKWCCQPIYADIEKAFRQDDDGQHDAALQTLDNLAKEHGGNPEVWGRKAELLDVLSGPVVAGGGRSRLPR